MNNSDKVETEYVLIKKYANRRLYHTERSQYVTLEDLAQMVKDGEDFVVQDAKTNEDITRSVLTQIIFDAENSGQMMLPTNFLREIIRLYGDSMQNFVPSYLENAMSQFMARQDELRSSLENAMSNNPAYLGFEQLTKLNQEWIENSMKMFGAMGAPIAAPKSSEASAMSDSAEELKELKTQLQDMQDKLAKLVDKS